MKSNVWLSITVCAMWLTEAGHAGPSSLGASPDGVVAHDVRSGRASPSSWGVSPDQARLKHDLSGNPAANLAVVQLPASPRPVAPPKLTPLMAAPNNAHLGVIRPPSIIQPAGPLLKDVRPRNSALVMLGPAIPKIKTTAAINGTGLTVKP